MLSRNEQRLLSHIYSFPQNIINLPSNSVFDNPNTFKSAWKELYRFALIDVIINSKNNVTSDTIGFSITEHGKREVEFNFTKFVLECLVTKQSFNWDDLKKDLYLEFGCTGNLPEHLWQFGMNFIHELVRDDVLTCTSTSYNPTVTSFGINQINLAEKLKRI